MNTAVIISGNGSNLQAIIDRWQEGNQSYDLKLVISNIPDVKGLVRAEKAGLPTRVIDHSQYESREAFDRAIDACLEEFNIELVALAGFLRLLSDEFVKKWAGRMINIHPSLLPAFPGLKTHRKAIAYGVKYSGCSVIFVDDGVDSGAIIDQAVVELQPDDDERSLARRILAVEHKIFPQALDDVAQGKVRLQGGRALRIQ